MTEIDFLLGQVNGLVPGQWTSGIKPHVGLFTASVLIPCKDMSDSIIMRQACLASLLLLCIRLSGL
jgi:hypothetical protein